MKNNFVFETDKAAKKIYIEREFNAPVEKLWKAWTDPEVLVQWWSPKPNKAVTAVYDFKVGGMWKFAMVTPEGNKHWLCARFTGIEDGSRILTAAVFCDADGNMIDGDPNWFRDTRFSAIGDNRSKVNIEITFEAEQTFDAFASAQNGYFKQGTAIGYDQLDEVLESL